MPPDKLLIGVVGLGKMGLLHASIMNAIPGTRVLAICESRPSLARLAKGIFPGVTIARRIEEMAPLHLDAVVVCTPIPSHSAVIRTIYGIGVRNVFTEKTLAADGKQASEIVALAAKSGGVNMVGYMARYAVTFQKARELLRGRYIGNLVSFKASAYSSDFIGIPEKSGLRGGVMRDLGSHIIDMAMSYFGELGLYNAQVGPLTPLNSEAVAFFQVRASNELNGAFRISWCEEGYRVPDYGLLITGSDGTIEVNNDSVKLAAGGQTRVWYRMDLEDNVPFQLGAAEYYREDLCFINALKGRADAQPDFEAAARVDQFIDNVRTHALVK